MSRILGKSEKMEYLQLSVPVTVVVLSRNELFLRLAVVPLVHDNRNVFKQNSINSAQELPSFSVVPKRRCQVTLQVILTDGVFC